MDAYSFTSMFSQRISVQFLTSVAYFNEGFQFSPRFSGQILVLFSQLLLQLFSCYISLSDVPFSLSHINVLVLVLVYTAIIESVLTTSITIWFGSATKHDRHRLHRITRTTEIITGSNLPTSIGCSLPEPGSKQAKRWLPP